MRYTKLSLCALLLLGLGLSGLQAQVSINATGGNSSSNGGSISFSVGQVFYTTHASDSSSISLGVQQAYEILEVTTMEEFKSINLTAYPNPANNYLNLEIKDIDILNLNFQVIDIQGNLLKSKIISSNATRIDMSELVPAIYFVKIIKMKDNLPLQEIKTFKIFKN